MLKLINSFEEKEKLLLDMGVDRVERLQFTRDFATLTAREYLKEVLIERFGAKAVIFGYDNKIGKDGADYKKVKGIADSLGLEIIACDAVGDISSTKIRSALEQGLVEGAASMLSYNYFLNGVVVTGNQLGRTIGFPTANMQLFEPLKMIPAKGVYLVGVELVNSKRKFYGMCNIGSRPTVTTDSHTTIETHIFNFDEYIYGLPIKLTFMQRLRGEQKFESLASLVEQLKKDERACLEILKKKSNFVNL